MTEPKKPVILVVEDQDYVAKLVIICLKRNFTDAEILHATNYLDAEDRIKEKSPGIVVTDIGFPLSPGSSHIDKTAGLQLIAPHVLTNDTIRFIAMSSEFSPEAKQFLGEYKIPLVEKDGAYEQDIAGRVRAALLAGYMETADEQPAKPKAETAKRPPKSSQVRAKRRSHG